MLKIDAIILAGGKGTRLQSVINDVPKPLAQVNGRPFLDILLSQLYKSGCIKKVILSVGYMAEMVIQRYKDRRDYGFEIGFSVEDKLLGTGGAIKKALLLTDSGNVLAMNGDSFTEFDVGDFIKTHIKNNPVMTMVLQTAENADRYGIVRLNGGNRISAFEEKKINQGQDFISAGIYAFRRELFDDVEAGREISIEKELLPSFLRRGVYGYLTTGKFIDIGTPDSYESAEQYLKEMS